MTKFELTQQLKTLISESALNKDEKERLLNSKSMSHHELMNFYRSCKPTSSMLKLLNTTRIVSINKAVKNGSLPKTKEYIKTMEYLRLKAQEDEYQQLLNRKSNVSLLYEQKQEDGPTAGKLHKEIKSHVTTMFNILLSVVSVAYAIWYWTETSWKIRDSYRVLLCLFFGILILIAEVVVYMGYLSRIEDARDRERKKKEVKKVIRSFTVN